MEPQPMPYHIARDGKVLGKFTLPQLAREFAQGKVTATDHYLRNGTTEWLLLAELRPMLERIEAERLEEEKQLAAEEERLEEERRKDAAAVEEANRVRAIRMAEAEKERKEAEHRQSLAFTCGGCGKQFAKPARTGDGQEDLRTSLYCLVATFVCGWISWHHLGSYMQSVKKADAVFYRFNAYVFLGLAVLGFYGMVRHLIIGGVARGLQAYQGAKSSCPECGSGNLSPTKFN